MPVVKHFLVPFRMRIPKYRYGWVLTRSDGFGVCMCIGLLWLFPSNDCDEFVFASFLDLLLSRAEIRCTVLFPAVFSVVCSSCFGAYSTIRCLTACPPKGMGFVLI